MTSAAKHGNREDEMASDMSDDQLLTIVAAILGAGAAAGQEGGCSGSRAVALYRQALKRLREEGLDRID